MKRAGEKVRALVVTLIAAALVVGLTGCATVRDAIDRGDIETRLLVSQGVQRYCLAQSDPAARCSRIAEIAARIKAEAQTNESLTWAALEQTARGMIRWDRMAPPDAELAEELLALLADIARDGIGDGALSPEDRIRVGQLMDWIIRGANRIT